MVREYPSYNIREASIEDLNQLDTVVKVVNDAYNVSDGIYYTFISKDDHLVYPLSFFF